MGRQCVPRHSRPIVTWRLHPAFKPVMPPVSRHVMWHVCLPVCVVVVRISVRLPLRSAFRVLLPSSHCHVVVPSLTPPTHSSAYRSHAVIASSAGGVARRPSRGRHAVVRTVAMRHSSRPAFRLDAYCLLCSQQACQRVRSLPALCLPASVTAWCLLLMLASCVAGRRVSCRVVISLCLRCVGRHAVGMMASRFPDCLAERTGARTRIDGTKSSHRLFGSPYLLPKNKGFNLLRIARGMSIVSRAIRVTGR